MGVFSRLTDIIQANLSAALDSAEDPQKLLRLMIQEMEETLIEVRSASASVIADKKALVRQLEDLQKRQGYWQQQAEKALEKGREDLAKSAQQEKVKLEQNATALSDELGRVEVALAKLADDMSQLQAKLQQAREKQTSFEKRVEVANTRLQAQSSLNSGQIERAMARFEEVERKVESIEAKVEAYELGNNPTLEQQFAKMQADEQVETALAELKAKLNKKS